MAKIHVLAGSSLNQYTVVVHIAVPGGDNAAGTLWKTAVVNSGRNFTMMSVGAGLGQITTTERDSILAGDLIEGVFMWGDDPAWNNAQRVADLDMRATQLTDELLARYQDDLKYWGFIRS